MKQKVICCFILFLLLLLLPLLAMGGHSTDDKPPKESEIPSSSSLEESTPAPSTTPPEAEEASDFKILDKSTGQVITVSDRDFLYGAIVTEMMPSEEEEALKAQGVAAYTYYSRLRHLQRENPDPELKGADFSADMENWNIYVTKEQMQERWGDTFEGYYEKLTKIVDEIYGQTLQYDGELICAVYCAISSGQTESSEDIWGGECSYLIPVASPGDAFANGYQTSVSLTEEQIRSTIEKEWPDCNLDSDPSSWFGGSQRTGSGSVETIEIGGQSIKGADVRTAFSLRSSNFEVNYSAGTFTFTVTGYGHGVGMSQAGACYMAGQGTNYRDILSWYYPGTVLVTQD